MNFQNGAALGFLELMDFMDIYKTSTGHVDFLKILKKYGIS